ncbi:glycerophosphodiester phosphodiesterase [Alkalihalobacillus sp. MEB130]|uniref:glycerophosphodiester phosphodiesterase n=1 Tax=Alkalihalobacillus sp. MEB130 TaxID=2976704 RepID=UPI0028DF0531|nr:glycerophosphodiester phosphodiesterase [Alkalihalobacillus sp. MEB130]MDT8862325.1 glycerophosphodiester phosphodiesterase [Alkalihalobacillus sp. MEB130]
MNQTQIFAHRGFSSSYPENTMAAFKAAYEAKADGIELDVQLSKDDVPVVIHDHTLERTTTGTGYVQHHTVQQLKQVSAGSWYSETFQKEEIPTLEEVFIWARGLPLIVNVELKGSIQHRHKTASIILPLIEKYELEEKVILSSFDHQLMALCNQQAPMVETAIIAFAALYDPAAYVRQVQALGYHFYFKSLLDDEIEQLIKKGLRLRPFTVNDEEEIRRFIQLGCDGIITDNPKKAVDIRNDNQYDRVRNFS